MHNKYCDVNLCGHPHPQGSHCQFDLWAPDKHSSINNLAFSAYAFHQEQIEAVIKILAAVDDPNDGSAQWEAFNQVGLHPNDLTLDEVNYIERKIEELYVKKNSTSFW